MAGRRKKIDIELIKAVDSDDTLTILKAQRKYVVDILTSPELDVREKAQMLSHLTRINVEINKIDKVGKNYSDDELEDFSDVEELRL